MGWLFLFISLFNSPFMHDALQVEMSLQLTRTCSAGDLSLLLQNDFPVPEPHMPPPWAQPMPSVGSGN